MKTIVSCTRALQVILCGVLLAGAAFAADPCWPATSSMPMKCNCAMASMDVEICHRSKVSTSSMSGVRVGSSTPGFAASAAAAQGQQVEVEESGCVSTSVDPGLCVFVEYEFECCWKEVIVGYGGWFWQKPKYAKVVDCQYKKFTLKWVAASC